MLKHGAFVLIINLLVMAVLYWVGDNRLRELQTLHQSIGKESVSLTADNVDLFIQENNRLIQLFAENELELIRQLAKSPKDEALQERLSARLGQYFPHHFTFTLANNQGEPLLEDIDGFVGEVCIKDLKRFAAHEQPLPRIHPNPEGYHFDTFTNYGDNEGILFISFHADILGNTLKSVEAHNHQLLLIMEASLNLIEVTADGARNHWVRDNYLLSNEEKDRILAMQRIPGTMWTATDLHTPELFSETKKELWTQAIVAMAIFISISLIFLFTIARTQKQREAAERIRDQFFSTISHELRTPLTAIRNSLSLVLGGISGELPKQVTKLINMALKQAERMSVMIDNTLDLRKLETGHLELDMQPVNLSKIVHNCIYSSEEYAKQFGVSFTLHCNEHRCDKTAEKNAPCNEASCKNVRIMVMANRYRIEQAINNLLFNAAKHGANNETVEVDISSTETMARIEIRDRGQGLPPAVQAELFNKPTMDAHNNESRTASHGLAIVNYIIQLHHGKIGYQTREGYGAIFYLELPLLKQGEDEK